MRYNIPQIADVWLKYGGNARATVPAVAICLAESGGNQYAISPSSDYGLWQINSMHFGSIGITAQNWSNDDVQVHAAIALSGNGTNWAAWCTAWPPAQLSNCGHGYVPYPLLGSAAWSHLAEVRAHIGDAAPGPVAAGPVNMPSVHESWNQVITFFAGYARTLDSNIGRTADAIGRLRK